MSIAEYTAATVTLVVAEPGQQEAAMAAVRRAGGWPIGPIGWREAAGQLDLAAAPRVMLAVTQDAAPAAFEAALPQLMRLRDTGGLRTVVTLDEERIDQVAGSLMTADVDLLCTPSDLELAAALGLAMAAGGTSLREASRDGDTRLRELNAEVARIAETLARLTRNDAGREPPSRSGGVNDRSLGFAARSPDAEPGPAIDPREVRNAIRSRRMRDQVISGGWFEDPAWDMLLDLFAAELERAQVSVSSLCIAAAVAPTTALRWLTRLTEAGLLERRPDPFDRRRAFMALAPETSQAMRRYVAAVRAAGVAIA